MLKISCYVFCGALGIFSGIVAKTFLDAVLLAITGALAAGFFLFGLIK